MDIDIRIHPTTTTPTPTPSGGPVCWYYDHFPLPLPGRHGYPRDRFARVRRRLMAEGLLAHSEAYPAQPADWTLLERVHTPDYLRALQAGSLSPQAIREIGLPFSPELVTRARAAVSATVMASGQALKTGAAGVIGGGTHHAFADHGAGYCLFNDIAVAIRERQRAGRVNRVAIVDLDVHQGNGNAEIFRDDPRVFTFSAHGARNWPYRKSVSDRDIALPDGTGDEDYLAAVEPRLVSLFEDFRPELVFYQAGADPLRTDRLGRLALTVEGLTRRDRLVLSLCHQYHCPVVVTLGGGYGVPLDDTVAVHVNTLRELRRVPTHPQASR